MKLTIALILLTISLNGLSQKTSTIKLGKGITITGTIENFRLAKHKLDTCTDEFKNKYICKIDGEKWFGSDQSMELPRNQLTSLLLRINQNNIPLKITGMFNPNFDGELSPDHFKLKKNSTGYMLYSFFSDGAGSYTVWWSIADSKSKRTLISSNEKYFSWQSNQ